MTIKVSKKARTKDAGTGTKDGECPAYGAKVATSPVLRGAGGALPWTNLIFGDAADFSSYAAQLREESEAVTGGDLLALERMLTTQANTLDAMFNALLRRAAVNVGEYMGAADVYGRLALKAQAQCRATVEALAEIKSPRPVAFVKQANIANGPQQVNNATDGNAPPASRARGKKSETTNELLTDERDGQTMDGGTASAASRSNPALATVGKLDGAAQ